MPEDEAGGSPRRSAGAVQAGRCYSAITRCVPLDVSSWVLRRRGIPVRRARTRPPVASPPVVVRRASCRSSPYPPDAAFHCRTDIRSFHGAERERQPRPAPRWLAWPRLARNRQPISTAGSTSAGTPGPPARPADTGRGPDLPRERRTHVPPDPAIRPAGRRSAGCAAARPRHAKIRTVPRAKRSRCPSSPPQHKAIVSIRVLPQPIHARFALTPAESPALQPDGRSPCLFRPADGGDSDRRGGAQYFASRAGAMRATAYCCARLARAEDLVHVAFTKLYVHWHRVAGRVAGPVRPQVLIRTSRDGARVVPLESRATC